MCLPLRLYLSVTWRGCAGSANTRLRRGAIVKVRAQETVKEAEEACRARRKARWQGVGACAPDKLIYHHRILGIKSKNARANFPLRHMCATRNICTLFSPSRPRPKSGAPVPVPKLRNSLSSIMLSRVLLCCLVVACVGRTLAGTTRPDLSMMRVALDTSDDDTGDPSYDHQVCV